MICGAALFDVSVNNPLLALGYNHIHSFKFSNDFPFCKFNFFSHFQLLLFYLGQRCPSCNCCRPSGC